MGKELYRFRPIKRLIEDGELEKQEIYFAPPESLNDPMEGHRDMFWSGDSIAWGNLFSHYIFCLHKVVMLALISERGTILTDDDIPVFDSVLELPTDNWKSTFQSINDTFFSNNKINLLISLLATRRYPIRRDELEIHLRTIHLFALKVVFDIFIEHGLCPESNRLSQGAEDALETICEETFNLRELI